MLKYILKTEHDLKLYKETFVFSASVYNKWNYLKHLNSWKTKCDVKNVIYKVSKQFSFSVLRVLKSKNQIIYKVHIVIWDTQSNNMVSFSLFVRGILIATIRHSMRRTGKLASCDATIPGFINIYLLSRALTLVL